MPVKAPSAKTLAKYGLTEQDFQDMLSTQKGKCGVCYGDLEGKQCYVDHEHRHGFKSMTSQEKKRCVRGVLDYTCNRFRVCKNNYLTAQAVMAYLDRHEDRKRRQASSTV